MSILGNILWLLLGGIFVFIEYVMSGVRYGTGNRARNEEGRTALPAPCESAQSA
jgi:hypothetical protein